MGDVAAVVKQNLNPALRLLEKFILRRLTRLKLNFEHFIG